MVDYMLIRSIIIFPLAFINIIAGVVADKWGVIAIFATTITVSFAAIIFGLKLKSRKQIEMQQR